MNIVADKTRLEYTMWNSSYGNKILHLLFVSFLCSKHNGSMIIPCDSNLDDMFDLDKYKKHNIANIPCIFGEESGHAEYKESLLLKIIRKLFNGSETKIYTLLWKKNIAEIVEKNKLIFKNDLNFLEKEKPSYDFTVKGTFWHYELMPPFSVFSNFLMIKNAIINKCIDKYPSLTDENSVAVHLRETDFTAFLRHVYKKSVVLDDNYYKRSIEVAEKKLGSNIVYHLFSDNLLRLEQIFKGRKYIIHKDDASTDWVSLFLSKNIIQSNSTFAWTASLYNKKFSVQPACGLNYHYNTGNVPYGFIMPFSDVITTDGIHIQPKGV